MPASGPVYQPTTVTYEASNGASDRWAERPISYLSHAARRPCLLTRVMPMVHLTSGIACFAIGVTLVIHGAIGYAKEETEDTSFYATFIITGVFGIILAFVLFVLYLRVTRKLCFRTNKDHLDTSGAQALTVNPSTDLLVSAQYGPISEVAYQPPTEDSEQSKLMPQENKDVTIEDTDRMVETDPRIVLRPLNPHVHEET